MGPEKGVSFPLGDPTRNAVILQSQSCEDEDEVVWVPKKRKAGRSNRATLKKRKIDGPPPTLRKPVTTTPKVGISGSKKRKRPTQVVNGYTFGTGDFGELGLGPDVAEIKRPRLVPQFRNLGVVAFAIGGMHGLALTEVGGVVSWGLSDDGTLGRPTIVEDSGSTPMNVNFPPGTVITQIAAGDNYSAAVTNDGHVYAWGTFRV